MDEGGRSGRMQGGCKRAAAAAGGKDDDNRCA